MTFSLASSWMLYTFLITLGVMWLDFLISFVRSLINGSFNLSLVLGYLKDMVFYIFPLLLIVALMPLDPVGWLLSIIFAIASLGVIVHYITNIAKQVR